MENSITLLIVEDEPKIGNMIETYLKSRGYTTFHVTHGEQAIEFLQKQFVELIILDIMLPDITGVEVIKQVRVFSQTPIIMLTARVQSEDKIESYQLGADDYITKPFSLEELEMRIFAQLRRVNEYNPILYQQESLMKGPFVLDLIRRTLKKNRNPIPLTPIQFAIIHILMEKPNQVFSREEIQTILSKKNFKNINARTIDTHVKNIRFLIEDDRTTPYYLQTEWGIGYKFISL